MLQTIKNLFFPVKNRITYIPYNKADYNEDALFVEVDDFLRVEVEHNSILCETFNYHLELVKEVEIIKEFPQRLCSKPYDEIRFFKTKTYVCQTCGTVKEFSVLETTKYISSVHENLKVVLSTKPGSIGYEVLNENYEVLSFWYDGHASEATYNKAVASLPQYH